MTGLPKWNYPAFFEMEKRLKDCGFTDIFNPASNPKDPLTTPWKEFMADAIAELVRCQQAVFLDGWRSSKGANREKSICDDLEIVCVDSKLLSLDETVLEEAERIVSSDRGNDYGTPFEDFSRTGKIWAAILGVDEVSPEKVALCMAGLKISRLCHKIKTDSIIDLAGYAKTLDLVDKTRKNLID
jgi:hypothetical protein